jgi:UDP-N-acetylmuramoyl-L-alanyl-D-glutamate--2,6-diaminopimelate ligase
VAAGSLFVAIAGARADGHDHAAAAVQRGAAGLVVERHLDIDVPQLVVADSRSALAVAASVVHRHPSRRLRVVGVTGTNGKTTVTHMIEAIGREVGLMTGLIGTLGARIGDVEVALERTTPESSDVQRLLGDMVDAGIEIAAMEVSSHALALHRADAIDFTIAAFTNLSQDHLDFHGTMEAYFTEKARLFTRERCGTAVVWADDPWGARLAAETDVDVVTVGRSDTADVYGEDIEARPDGSTFTLHAAGKVRRVRIPVPARFNVDNALVAAAVCLEAGIEFTVVCRALEALPQIPGRLEVVAGPWPFQVLVDYAHTPDAVAAVISEMKSLGSGRVLALVGAGGDRDEEKRPLMGAAAATADLAIITSDNPRSEDPAAIIADVAGGLRDDAGLVVEVDRRAAIRKAMDEAAVDDIVLVLGKGHEQGQEFAEGIIEPFDDRVVVREEGATISGGLQ